MYDQTHSIKTIKTTIQWCKIKHTKQIQLVTRMEKTVVTHTFNQDIEGLEQEV